MTDRTEGAIAPDHRTVPTDQNNHNSEPPKLRKKRCCLFCQNHRKYEPKNSLHNCQYENKCKCTLCKITKTEKKVMKLQQQIWRIQKLKNKDGEMKRTRKCDACRNHSIFVDKRKHLDCPYKDCTCKLCQLAHERRGVMKHVQQFRRLGVTSDEVPDPTDESINNDIDKSSSGKSVVESLPPSGNRELSEGTRETSCSDDLDLNETNVQEKDKELPASSSNKDKIF